MNYELERKLNDKVDKWEFFNLQNENRDLKNTIHTLEQKVDNLQATNNNRYYVIESLISMLAEHELFRDYSNDLIILRNQL